MPRPAVGLNAKQPLDDAFGRVVEWVRGMAPGAVDAVKGAAESFLGPENPPVYYANKVMNQADPMNAMGIAMPIAYHGTPGPKFSAFRGDKATSNMAKAISDLAPDGTTLHFAAKHPVVAEGYAGPSGNVAKVDVNLRNPMIVNAAGKNWDEVVWPAVQDATEGYRNEAHKRMRDLQTAYSKAHGEDYWDALTAAQQAELEVLSQKMMKDPVSKIPGPYDGIEIRGVLDSADGVPQPTDVYVAFNPEQMKILEWLNKGQE